MGKIFARRLAWGAFYTGLLAILIGQFAGILLVVLGLVAALLLSDGHASGLLYAIENGEIARAKEILSSPEAGKILTKQGPTALSLAARHGHGELVGLLLEKGVKPDELARGDDPALAWAVVAGHPAIARRLLEAGADPCLKKRGEGGLGSSAFRSALSREDIGLVEAMLQTGRISQDEMTKALASVVLDNQMLPYIPLLLAAGARPDQAIDYAIQFKRTDALRLLRPENPNLPDEPPLLPDEPPLLSPRPPDRAP